MRREYATDFVINALEKRCNMGYSINDILNKEGIEKILFDIDKEISNLKFVDVDIFDYLRSKKCDLSEINFDDVVISGLDFTGFKGVKINPQTVGYKDLSGNIFNGVEFTGSFDGCYIPGSDFKGSVGAVINPQTIMDKYLAACDFQNVVFVGSFDGTTIFYSFFEGSKGAKINPNRLSTCGLIGTSVEDVEFTEPIFNCYIDKADFTGSKNAVILADEMPSFVDTILTDTIVIGNLNENCRGVLTEGAIFLGKIVNKNEKVISKKKFFEKRNRYVGKHERWV